MKPTWLRLYISGKFYDQLCPEKQGKILNYHLKIEERKVGVVQYLDKIQVALALIDIHLGNWII